MTEDTIKRPGRGKLLSLNFFPAFYPPLSGGEQRSYFLCKALAEDWDVVAVTPTYGRTRNEVVRHTDTFVEHRFTKIQAYSDWHAKFNSQAIGVGGADLAMALAIGEHTDLDILLTSTWDEFDVIVVQHPCAFPLIKNRDLNGKVVIYASHNCELEVAGQRMTEAGWHDFLSMLSQLELRLCKTADLIAVCSVEDKYKLSALYGISDTKFILAANGMAPRFSAEEVEASRCIDTVQAIFVGTSWSPNVAAAKFIAQTLAPAAPGIEFHIVGEVCHALESVQCSNVVLHYRITDGELATLMLGAHFGLNPIVSGGGSNIKIADYLAHGLRVISTPMGVRGFSADYENVVVADLDGFADALDEFTHHCPSGAERARWIRQASASWSWAESSKELVQAIRGGRTAELAKPKRRTIVLNEFPVRGASNGGEARIAGLFREARDGEQFVILTFGRELFGINVLSPQLVCVEIPATASQKAEAVKRNAGTYSSVNDFTFPETIDQNPFWLRLARMIGADADGIIFSHPFMLPVYERLLLTRPFIHDSHNIEATLKDDALETHELRERYVEEARRQEAFMAEHAKLIAACSEADAEYFSRIGARNVIVAGNGVEMPDFSELSPERVLEGEARYGHYHFDERWIYLIEEFLSLHDEDFLKAAAAAVLGRKNGRWSKENSAPVADRARYLKDLLALPHARRVLIVGLDEHLGMQSDLLVFMGSGHRPNLSAGQLLANVIAPQLPHRNFLIIGTVCGSMQREAMPFNLVLGGFVSPLMKAYLLSRARIGLNPMIGGGGSNLKIPDYLSHGLTVISSNFGQRGFSMAEEHGLHSVPLYAFAKKIEDVLTLGVAGQAAKHAVIAAVRRQYSWNVISARFLDAARPFLHSRQTGPILIVLEDMELLNNGAPSNVVQLVRWLTDQGLVTELIGDATSMSPSQAALLADRLPSRLERVTATTADLEDEICQRELQDGLSANEAFIVSTADSLESIRRHAEQMEILRPVLLSGASAVVGGRKPWRYIAPKAVILVPEDSRMMILEGWVHGPTSAAVLTADGKLLFSAVIDGEFRLDVAFPWSQRMLILQMSPAIGTSMHSFWPAAKISRLAVEMGQVVIETNPWANCANILSDLRLSTHSQRILGGRTVRRGHQHLHHLVAERSSLAESVLVVGSRQFAAGVATSVARKSVIHCDGGTLRDLVSTRSISLEWPLSEAEMALISNPREMKYLAGPVQETDIVLFAETLDEETMRFADVIQAGLRASVLGGAAHVVVSDGSAQGTDDRIQKFRARVNVLSSLSDKAMLSVVACSGMVVVGDCPLRFGRIPQLLTASAAMGLVLRSRERLAKDVFDDLPSAASAEEALALFWSSGRQAPPFLVPERWSGDLYTDFIRGEC